MSTKNTHLRRKDRLRTETEARDIINGCDFAVLSTADNDNMPYGVPVSVVLEENRLYFHCAKAGRKLENIQQNPNVCVTFAQVRLIDGENFTTRYESVIAEGTAAIVEEETEKCHALQLICRRYTQHSDEEIDAYIQRYFAQTGVVRVDLESISAKANI
ncbi:pyridoxamine 5'-phosphate oxidase family protein [Anaerotignum sp.]|uniref:pyridoxamine 5'-phosphate oxidase family protein n=2 Tax=Anaerotignum sp. TaxID=2039241 RepID=UPI0027B88FE0|nr:pyridoxamine 5'-phosphate oxidase family protein [Anaerotignum sp.]